MAKRGKKEATPKTKVKVSKVDPNLSKAQRMVKLMDEDLGAGSIQLLDGSGASIKISGVISTRFENLDAAIGRGGVPFGRLTILHGKEGSAKTTLALALVASVQAMGGLALYMDTEHKLDTIWAQKCGVNLDELLISQPQYLERAMMIISRTVDRAQAEKIPLLIVLDSMNATQSKKQFEADWEEADAYGPQAMVFSQKLPKLMDHLSQDAALIFVSQPRSGPGVKNKIAGGNAPKFYASMIIQFSPAYDDGGGGSLVKVGSKVVAANFSAYITKNQVAPPFQRATIRIGHDGPDYQQALLDQAVSCGFMSKGGGGWYEWSRGDDDLVKFQGANGWRKILKTNESLEGELRGMVRERFEI